MGIGVKKNERRRKDVHWIFTKSDENGRYTRINNRTKAQTFVDSNEECE